MEKKEIILILHNIRSTHNVGSILRTADGAGVSKVYLVGYTPAPTDKFGRANSKIAKVALGAEKSVLWEEVKSISSLLKKLKKEDVQIVALEQSEDSVDYREFKPQWPIALILGEETEGIPKAILKQCDATVEIPMKGDKESLNVSVATGIALFQII